MTLKFFLEMTVATTLQTCRICETKDNHASYVFEEQMIGLYNKFNYFQCNKCECLQIEEVPDDIAKYYEEGYYSFRKNPSRHFSKPVIKTVAKVLFGQAMKGRDILSSSWAPDRLLGFWTKFQAIGRANVTKNSKVIDIGSGSGSVVYAMGCIGFKNVKGLDPFIEKDIEYPIGVNIIKGDIGSHTETDYDLIMMHHSFEHMPNPHEVFEAIPKLLAPNGVCLIRIPTISTSIFEKYGKDLVELDAPRHIFLHSKKSIEYLAEQHGLKIDQIVYDSTPFQFWGSELYQKNISLKNAFPLSQHFSKSDMKKFREDSVQLNKTNQGSRFCVYLSKK